MLLKDKRGNILWGAASPMPGYSESQALIWAIQVGVVKACKLHEDRTHVEIVNEQVYEILRDRNHIFIVEDLREVIHQFDSFFANYSIEDVTVRRASLVPFELNQTAEYMARYGMDQLSSFVETPGIFGNLQEFLDMDMSHFFPFEILPNFGLGEVIDPPTPPPQVPEDRHSPEAVLRVPQIELLPMDEHPFDPLLALFPFEQVQSPQPPLLPEDSVQAVFHVLNSDSSFHCNAHPPSGVLARSFSDKSEVKWKGKGKVLNTYSFNRDGLLSQEAIETLDSGFLVKWFPCFDNDPIDLDEQICEGVYAKDVLESVVTNSLDSLLIYINSVTSNNSSGGSDFFSMSLDMDIGEDLMEVEDILVEMAMFDEHMEGGLI